MQKPRVGMMVNYGGDEVYAAVVTQVNLSGLVNLTVFLPDGTIQGKSNITMAAGPKSAARNQWWFTDRL